MIYLSLWRVGACQLVGFFELGGDGRCLLVDLHLVPALLEEIGAIVVAAIGVAEGDILDIVVGGIETVGHHVGECRVASGEDIHKHRLAGTVTSDDGDMLTFL